MKFRVESVVAGRGLVLARPVEKGALLATPRARLGGRLVAHFELPRKLRADGTQDLELIAFVLQDAGDVAHFPIGAVVDYRDDEH